MDIGSPSSSKGDKGDKGDKEKAKRGYRACLACRKKKAKCDLGDIDAPSSPPCSRCKRESRECVFAPSRRGGNNVRRKAESLGLDLGNVEEGGEMKVGSLIGKGEPSAVSAFGAQLGGDQYDTSESSYYPAQRHSFSAITSSPDRPGPHAVQDAATIHGRGRDADGKRGAAAVKGGQALYTAQGVRISPNASAPSVLHAASARIEGSDSTARHGAAADANRHPPQGHGPIPLSDVEAVGFSSTGSHTRPRPYGSALKDLLHSSSPQHNPYSAGSTGAMSSLDPSPAAATTGSPTTSTNHPTPRWPISHDGPAGRAASGRKGLDGREGSTSPKRRKLQLNPPMHADDPSSLVVADVQNESDALHILALASGSGARGRHHMDGGSRQDAAARTRVDKMDDSLLDPSLRSGDLGVGEATGQPTSMAVPNKGPIPAFLSRQAVDNDALTRSRSQSKALVPGRSRNKSVSRELKDYELVRKGIVGEDLACRLVDIFFRCHHHLFPMVPASLIPRTPEEIGVFANNERYLMAAIIIIASRNDMSIRAVHDDSWALFRGWISDLAFLGGQPTIDLVESLLLLAENLPRDPTKDSDSSHVHGAENRQAWMLIGCAIRNAYGLGIDKIASRFVPEQERTFELERARLAWTYCYLFDRHVSLRLGLAFWSRGPSFCFQGFSDSAQTGPAAAAANFPYLLENSDGPERERQEDMAGLVQAYIELTQIMTNAHDVLYPNPARTRSLVMYGEYFKYIDELIRSLEGFKIMWQHKKWNVFPLNDVLWAMYFYTQLYLCAFSFQAHVERAAMRAEEDYTAMNDKHKAAGGTTDLPRPPLSLFPRGAAASPDCRYIFQSCDAARTLLHICTDSLGPGGALPFLPSRYLLWFTYAAIVLLKALYSGAMLRADHAETLSLIDQLCICLASASTDDEHPAVRYGRQLEALRRKLASSTSAESQGPGSPGGIAGVATVAPDVPASIAKPPPPAAKKGKATTRVRPVVPPRPDADAGGRAISSDAIADKGYSGGPAGAMGAHGANSGTIGPASPVWTMPAAPDQADGVSFAYPATPVDTQGAAATVKHEPQTHTQHASGSGSTHRQAGGQAESVSLSNFGLAPSAPFAGQTQYTNFPSHNSGGLAYMPMSGTMSNQPTYSGPPHGGMAMMPYPTATTQPAAGAAGNTGPVNVNGNSGLNLPGVYGTQVNQYQGGTGGSNGNMQHVAHAHAHGHFAHPNNQPQYQQQTQAMGADFEANNLGFPQLLDDWFGPAQEEDEGLGALDLQDFWMKVGPGEAQGGFPFR